MRLTEARQGVRMLKFMDVFGRWDSAELNQVEAAELLGVGERTFRRWCRRYEEDGEGGLLDRRIGKASGKRVPVDRCEEVERLYRTRYQGFTARHFHEHLVRDHRFAWSYSWTKAFLQSRNLLPKAERRGAHRRKRPRRPLPGMMLHQDASRHAWLAEGPALDLVVTMDDATSGIYSAFLVEEEGTDSTFRALLEVFGRHGLPLSLYTDRGSHYFYTAEVGGKVDRGQPTQVGRALAHLGVEHIAAYSPQARGRSERLFQTPAFAGAGSCKIACRRNWHWRASRRWPKPTPGCATLIYRRTTHALRPRQSRKAAPSSRCPGWIWQRCCASRKNASSATTTAYRTSIASSRSRRARCVHTSSRRR
jgi:transposase